MPGTFHPTGIVTLTTDFGTRDHYVAAMKGEMLRIYRQLVLVDTTHDIPAQDVDAAGYLLSRCLGNFPAGTVHLAVVDPGVGSNRAALVLVTRDMAVVAPDNGLVSPLLEDMTACHRIEPARLGLGPLSRTFHGRDLFAPVAAMLAAGRITPADCGPHHKPNVTEPARARREGDRLLGEVVHVDGFGNLVTNIPRALVGEAPIRRVRVGERAVETVVDTYAQASPGTLVALWGSGDHLEVSVVDGSAASHLGLARGTKVVCALEPASP